MVTAFEVDEVRYAYGDIAALNGVTLRADSNYDSNKLYRAVARRKGRLIASRKKPGTGLGHTKHHPDRLKAIGELERTDEALRAHRRHRIRVEQTLGHLTNLPFGLSPLPNCVRRKSILHQQHRIYDEFGFLRLVAGQSLPV